jgi:hypothetical protein
MNFAIRIAPVATSAALIADKKPGRAAQSRMAGAWELGRQVLNRDDDRPCKVPSADHQLQSEAAVQRKSLISLFNSTLQYTPA